MVLTHLLLGRNFNVGELDYGCGPSSSPITVTYRCKVNEDDQDCEEEGGDEDGDNESDGDGHVSSLLTLNQLINNDQGRYVSMDVPSSDVSNNPDSEDPDPEDPHERGTVNYYLAPSP